MWEEIKSKQEREKQPENSNCRKLLASLGLEAQGPGVERLGSSRTWGYWDVGSLLGGQGHRRRDSLGRAGDPEVVELQWTQPT